MLAHILVTTLSLTGPPAAADTLVEVEPGTRISIRNHEGSITVRGWDRAAVRVVSDRSDARLELSRAGRGLLIRARNFETGGAAAMELTVTVPTSSPVSLNGPFADMTVEGVEANVTAETVDGDIRVSGGRGLISLQTVEGSIDLRDATGRISAVTVDGELELSSLSGDITASTLDGDIRLEEIDSSDVKATTIDGDITFGGTLARNGLYRLSTHDGDLLVAIPEGSDVTVSVDTFSGAFGSSFPVTLQSKGENRRIEFTLGSGAARLELQAFDGEIRLRRPGERGQRDR
ncbi:MAG: DUF4097 domain-containing protein [Gemmatimonadota bacterium]